MVPLDMASLTFYRLSIVTIPLFCNGLAAICNFSLRVLTLNLPIPVGD